MEEILLNVSGWSELGIDSSELQIVGGATQSLWLQIVEKVRNIIDFIGDYVPKFIEGFVD